MLQINRLALLVLFFYPLCGGASTESRVAVSFVGVEGDLLTNVKQFVTLEQQSNSPRLSDGRIQVLYQRGPGEIRAALQALGHYRPVIESSIDQVEGTWQILYAIEPGPPLPIGTMALRIEGEAGEDPAFAALRAGFPLRTGETLNHGRYEEAKRSLESLANERGYFDSRFVESQIRIDLEAYAAHIEIEYASGERYRFGDVAIPDTVVEREFFNRFVYVKRGEPYLAAVLLKTESALRNSDYFSEVRVTAHRDQSTDRAVPVTIEIEPKKRNRYSLGAGFGTDTGPRARLGWERRYVTRSGHRFKSDLRVSPVINSVAAQYIIPIRDPTADSLTFTSSVTREDTEVTNSLTFRVGAARAAPRWGWAELLSLDYEFEDFDVADDSETAGLLIPGVRYSRVWADDRLYTSRGLSLAIGLEGAHEAVLSAVSFVKTDISAKYIREVFEDKGRVLLRANLGALATSDFDGLSTTHRFFAGGDNSIRGFDFEELGPKDETGAVIGGKYLAVGSIEYEHVIKGKWSAAVFSDFGNAFDDFSEDLELGVGIGVRWRSPVGLVRVDVATGVSEPDTPVRLHIVIGPDL